MKCFISCSLHWGTDAGNLGQRKKLATRPRNALARDSNPLVRFSLVPLSRPTFLTF